MKPEILLIDPVVPAVDAALRERFVLHQYEGIAALGDAAGRIRGVATGGGSGLAPDIMAALPMLEVISVNGVGTDRIDLVEAKRRGIGVATTQGVLTNDVADLGIALMLDVVRGVTSGDRFVRKGLWPTTPIPLERSITGKKVGIAGLGHIGQAIASRALAFGTEVAYFNRSRKTDSTLRYEPDLLSLATWSDILILVVPGGPATHNMVNRAVLDALGPNGFLVNVARGSVVDEQELLSALQEKRIAGAGLDVFAHEPAVPEAFFALENVVLQAHRASATQETRAAMGKLVVDNLYAHFDGKPLLTPVI